MNMMKAVRTSKLYKIESQRVWSVPEIYPAYPQAFNSSVSTPHRRPGVCKSQPEGIFPGGIPPASMLTDIVEYAYICNNVKKVINVIV